MLQHPERVVPLSECERFDTHFQPNVALAPNPIPPLPNHAHPVLRHRRHEQSHRESQQMPEDKQDSLPVNVKLEKSPSPELKPRLINYPDLRVKRIVAEEQR